MIEYDLLELFPDTITLETRTGLDEFSKPSYGLPVPVKARVEATTRKINMPDGEERVASAVTYLADLSVPIDITDRITLPDGKQPSILAVHVTPDTTGPWERSIWT